MTPQTITVAGITSYVIRRGNKVGIYQKRDNVRPLEVYEVLKYTPEEFMRMEQDELQQDMNWGAV